MSLTTDKTKKYPKRTCVACRQEFDKRDLLRVVRSPEGVVSVDTSGKASGRGAYICSDVKCVEKCAKGILRKHLSCDIPAEIYEEISRIQSAKR